MKKRIGRSLALIFSVMLVFSNITAAFADDEDDSSKITFTCHMYFQDGFDVENKRPESVEIKIVDTILEETYKTVKLDASNNWECEVSLPAGNEYKALPAEDVSEYLADIESHGMDNDIIMTLVYDFSGYAVWNDADNKDDLRPSDLTGIWLALNKNGEENVYTSNMTNDGYYNFYSWPVYDENGNKNTYSVNLFGSGYQALPGYEAKLTSDNNVELTRLTDIKTYISWTDGNDMPGERPDKITAVLYDRADKDLTYSVDLTKDNNWTANCTVSKYEKNGSLKSYGLNTECTEIENYTNGGIVYGDNEIMIPETYSVDMPVKVIWNDGDNAENTRPASLTVKLCKDGTEEKGSAELNQGNNWTATFGVLPLYDTDDEINYTHKQEKTDGYVQTTAYMKGDGTFVFVNTLTEDIDVSIEWNDGNSADRPKEVMLSVLRNGRPYDTLTLSADDGWKCTLTGCLKYDGTGAEYEYTISADDIRNYSRSESRSEDKYIFTYTELINISGTKTWSGCDKYPESITVRLLADGTETAEKTVTAADNWQYSFEAQEKYTADGRAIAYTVKEDPVDGFVVTYNGNDITNTQTTVKITNVDSSTLKAVKGAKTGDPNDLTPWIIIIIAAAAAAVTAVIIRKNKRKRRCLK